MKRNLKLSTTWNEFWPIVNILNEVCHGIDIDNHVEQVGYQYIEILNLLKKIKSQKQSDQCAKINIELLPHEIEIIKASYQEVLKQIEDWEFQTRIGVTKAEIDTILSKLA